MYFRSPKRIPQGFSLVELMLSSLISIFLLTGLFEVYLSVKSTYYLQTALSQLQENGRFAVNYLNYSIHHAGYAECNPEPERNKIAVQGYNRNSVPGFLSGQLVAGTDAIVVSRCFEVDNHMQFSQVAYFIGDTLQKNINGAPIYALYEKALGHNRQELVSGVEGMKITYGLQSKLQADILEYLPAEKIENWQSVAGVKISLLLNSIDNVLPKAQTYLFNGKEFISIDKRLHREWDCYIALRNK